MKRNWIFTSNSFNVATKTSAKKMLVIAADTDGKLANQVSDPEILVIYNDYHPVYDAYRLICLNYSVVVGERKGETFNIVTLMDTDLPVKLRLWEGKIFNIYPEGSVQEKSIFPNGRKPFNTGGYDARISAVGALATKLGTDPNFATLAPQVESYYNILRSARSLQTGKEGAAKTLSSQRDNQRKLVAKSLYGMVLAKLMTKFSDDTTQIDNFFDLSLIRKGTVAPDEAIVRGKVTTGNGIPVAKAPVMLVEPGGNTVTKITNVKGNYRFDFKHLHPGTGTVTLQVEKEGYEPYETSFTGAPGNIYVENIILTPAQTLRKVA